MAYENKAESANVIAFRERDNGEVVKERPASECRHYHFEVDQEERQVYCGQCDKLLDPIFVLERLMQIYSERDYKYDKIMKFEEEERARAQRRRERYAQLRRR